MSNNLKVINYIPVNKGKLLGRIDIFIQSIGLEIYDLTIFQDGGKRWFNLPQRDYVDKETGERRWIGTMRFPNELFYKAFMEALRKEFDRYCEEKSGINKES